MEESAYQSKLKKFLESNGWTVIKIVRATVNGYPDMIACKSDRPPLFIEVKGEKGKLSKVQEYRIEQLRHSGFEVMVLKPSDYDDFVRHATNGNET